MAVTLSDLDVLTLAKRLGTLPRALMLHHLLSKFLPGADGTLRKWVRRGKGVWYAKSHQAWFKDCGLTRQTVRTAENWLVANGLIETVVWMFDGTPIKHYRLDTKELHEILVKSQPIRLVRTNQSIMISIRGSAKALSKQNSSYLLSGAKNAPQPPGKKGEGMGKIEGWKKKPHEIAIRADTSQEVLRKLNERKNSIQLPTKIAAKPLLDLWTKLVPMHVDKQFHKPMGMKELGQMKLYIGKVGPTHAVPAIEWAVANWDTMRYRAQEDYGTTLPHTPTVGGLLMACSVAVEGYLKAQVVATPVDSTPIVVQTSAKSKEVKATKAQIAQALKEMKGE